MPAATHRILVILIAIAAGFVCRRLKVITEEGTSTLSGIVVKAILPFYLFNAIANSDAPVDAGGVALAIGLSAAMFVVCGIIALAAVPLLKAPTDDRGVYIFELLCANVTYIGIPVCDAVFGGNAAFYASLLHIPYNLICFSLGIFLLCGKASVKMALNPAFISGVLGSIFFVFKIPLPAVVSDACKFIGQATSPCSMLVIGSVLGSVSIKEMFGEWRVIPVHVPPPLRRSGNYSSADKAAEYRPDLARCARADGGNAGGDKFHHALHHLRRQQRPFGKAHFYFNGAFHCKYPAVGGIFRIKTEPVDSVFLCFDNVENYKHRKNQRVNSVALHLLFVVFCQMTVGY